MIIINPMWKFHSGNPTIPSPSIIIIIITPVPLALAVSLTHDPHIHKHYMYHYPPLSTSPFFFVFLLRVLPIQPQAYNWSSWGKLLHFCQRSLHFWIWASKVPFILVPKTATAGDFGCKKWFWTPKSKNRDHFLSPTVPKYGGIDFSFTWITFLGEFWANFENRVF